MKKPTTQKARKPATARKPPVFKGEFGKYLQAEYDPTRELVNEIGRFMQDCEVNLDHVIETQSRYALKRKLDYMEAYLGSFIEKCQQIQRLIYQHDNEINQSRTN